MARTFVIEVKNNLSGEKTYLGTVSIANGKLIDEHYSGLSAPVSMNIEDGRPKIHPFKPGLTGLITEI